MAYFSYCCNLLSKIGVKSLHKTAGLGGIWVFAQYQKGDVANFSTRVILNFSPLPSKFWQTLFFSKNGVLGSLPVSNFITKKIFVKF